MNLKARGTWNHRASRLLLWVLNCLSTFLSSGWTNNQLGKRQINSRKWQNVLHMYIRGSIRIWNTWTHWAGEAYMPFWTKEREGKVWDFKGKAGNSQVGKKEQRCGKQILPGPPRNNSTQTLLDLSLSAILNSYMLRWIC